MTDTRTISQLEAEGYPWIGCECCKGTVWVSFKMIRQKIRRTRFLSKATEVPCRWSNWATTSATGRSLAKVLQCCSGRTLAGKRKAES